MAPVLSGSMEPLVGNVRAHERPRLFGGNLIAAGVAWRFWLWPPSCGFCRPSARAISYGGFRACRRDNRIEVERGLLQHQFPGRRRRPRAVGDGEAELHPPPAGLLRAVARQDRCGGRKLRRTAERASAAGLGDPSLREDEPRARDPCGHRARVRRRARGEQRRWRPWGCAARSSAAASSRGPGFWLAVIVAIGQIARRTCVLAIPDVPDGAMAVCTSSTPAPPSAMRCASCCCVLDAVGAVLWFRGSGFAYNERFMQVSNGGFARETISFPRKKIQFGYTKTNPFQRRARTATVNARTAAGVGGTTIRLIDVCEEDARRGSHGSSRTEMWYSSTMSASTTSTPKALEVPAPAAVPRALPRRARSTLRLPVNAFATQAERHASMHAPLRRWCRARRPSATSKASATSASTRLGEEIANSVTHGLGIVCWPWRPSPFLVVRAARRIGGGHLPVRRARVLPSPCCWNIPCPRCTTPSPSTGRKRVFKVLDHSCIYLFIAGSYTPFCLISLADSRRRVAVRVRVGRSRWRAWPARRSGCSVHVGYQPCSYLSHGLVRRVVPACRSSQAILAGRACGCSWAAACATPSAASSTC